MRLGRALPVVVSLLAGGGAGYALGTGEGSAAGGDQPLRACPASAWTAGGGYDYAVAGMSCQEANRFITTGRRYQPGKQRGRALRFGPWVCFQTTTTDRTQRPAVLNVCAHGESRLRFLAAG
jgi:hypothetical protein